MRRPEKLKQVPWAADVDVRTVDLDTGGGLDDSLGGIETAYYLVHSMGSGGDFEAAEAEAARRFACAAASAGVCRIVYLGGLHPEGRELSKHMRSRANVGRILLDSEVDAIVFNAGIIIGSGSASFEMIRHLATTLRWMPAPDWVSNRVEPLSVRDALYYLLSAADVQEAVNRSFDIGSRQILTYANVMRTFAAVAGLKPRHVIALPLPAPTLSGIWVGLVTPLPFSLTLPLVQSLQEDAVASDQGVDAVIPPPESGLIGFADAVRLALRREVEGAVDTNWDADAGGLDEAAQPLPNDPQWSGRRIFTDERSTTISGVSAEVWPVIEGIGGTNGWYRGRWHGRFVGSGTKQSEALASTGLTAAGHPAHRRSRRLVASRTAGAELSTSAARRDESLRSRVARIHTGRLRRRLRVSPDSDLHPHRAARPHLLGPRRPVSSLHLPRHGEEHRSRGAAPSLNVPGFVDDQGAVVSIEAKPCR